MLPWGKECFVCLFVGMCGFAGGFFFWGGGGEVALKDLGSYKILITGFSPPHPFFFLFSFFSLLKFGLLIKMKCKIPLSLSLTNLVSVFKWRAFVREKCPERVQPGLEYVQYIHPVYGTDVLYTKTKVVGGTALCNILLKNLEWGEMHLLSFAGAWNLFVGCFVCELGNLLCLLYLSSWEYGELTWRA